MQGFRYKEFVARNEERLRCVQCIFGKNNNKLKAHIKQCSCNSKQQHTKQLRLIKQQAHRVKQRGTTATGSASGARAALPECSSPHGAPQESHQVREMKRQVDNAASGCVSHMAPLGPDLVIWRCLFVPDSYYSPR